LTSDDQDTSRGQDQPRLEPGAATGIGFCAGRSAEADIVEEDRSAAPRAATIATGSLLRRELCDQRSVGQRGAFESMNFTFNFILNVH
jgi:hypothetical protein